MKSLLPNVSSTRNLSIVTAILFMFFLLSPNVQAVTIFCSADADDDKNAHNLFVEEIDGIDCEAISLTPKVSKGRFKLVTESKPVYMSLLGLGLGFRVAQVEGFMINCPLVPTIDKLQEHIFVGVKAGAAVIAGASAGVFSNKKAGVCLLTSLQGAGLGVGVAGAMMVFH